VGFNSVYGKCYNLGCLVVERLLFGWGRFCLVGTDEGVE
jgi:hypothetical protein